MIGYIAEWFYPSAATTSVTTVPHQELSQKSQNHVVSVEDILNAISKLKHVDTNEQAGKYRCSHPVLRELSE